MRRFNVDLPPINVLSLCSGVGMLDLAIGTAFDVRTVCYVEREAFACAQLVNLMEAGCLDAAPVWSDLATFDGQAWRGIVDIIVAGLPCQPYSVAGKRQGNSDHRSHGDGDGPIPHFLRIVEEARPALVFLENVPAWVTAREQWFKPVGERLSALGYRIERPLFLAASDVGASHKRERVFILAHCPERGLGILRQSSGGDEDMGNAESNGSQGGQSLHGEHDGQDVIGRCDGVREELADASSPRPQGSKQRTACDTDRGGQEAHGSTEQFRGVFAPSPSDPSWLGIIERWPWLAPATQPGIRSVVARTALLVDASRNHQLRALGNGCVPLQAALAFAYLARRAGLMGAKP